MPQIRDSKIRKIMEDNNDPYKHDFSIGRFGQTADGDSDHYASKKNGFKNHFALERPTSYKEVIAYLENILRDAPPGKEILVQHQSNPYYKDHKTWFGLCNDNIYEAIAFVKARREQEKQNKLRQVGDKLWQLENAILNLEQKMGNNEIVLALKNLHHHLNADILADRCYKPSDDILGIEDDEEPEYNGPNLSKTNYPVIIEHFIGLTKQLTLSRNPISIQEIKASEQKLEKKLHEQPISPRLRAAIFGVFGAIIGLTVALVGSVLTGGVLPSLVVGATIGLAGGSLFGFFHARRHNQIIEARKQKFEVIDDDGKRTAEPEKYAHETFEHIKASLTK